MICGASNHETPYNPPMDTTETSRFLPADFDPSDFVNIEPRLRQLEEREIDSARALQRWLMDFSQLAEAVDECGTRRSIDYSRHTNDEALEAAYMHFVEQIQPKLRPWYFKLQQKFVASPHRDALTGSMFELLGRQWQSDVELFHPRNISLLTDATKLSKEYDKLCGAMLVEYRGKQHTLQQMAVFQEEINRDVRQQTWRLSTERRLADRDAIDTIFDKLLKLRHQIAANADLDGYRDYIWRDRYRFDYTPNDCLRFGDAVAETCVPLIARLDEQRRGLLGVDTLRPWDLAVDVHQRPPLRPFAQEQIDDFVQKTHAVFKRISPDLADQFASLRQDEHLDLDSRPHKKPGGSLEWLELTRQPFIFMNAAGLQRDVETLLHEAGHAFHFLAARHEELLFARHAALEFDEVASMSMELLGCDHFDVFYDDAVDAARAKRLLLEGIVRLLPWVATIDGFQHWLYTHPGHDLAARTAAWRELLDRFYSPVVDYSGLEDTRDAMWHRQLHLFSYPFYYIEYGIAQLGALQVWLNYQNDPQGTLRQLLDAFALAGTRPLPQLYEAAGIRFAFDKATLQPLLDAVQEELSNLPD